MLVAPSRSMILVLRGAESDVAELWIRVRPQVIGRGYRTPDDRGCLTVADLVCSSESESFQFASHCFQSECPRSDNSEDEDGSRLRRRLSSLWLPTGTATGSPSKKPRNVVKFKARRTQGHCRARVQGQ
jgi:hypothetical protein